MLVTNSYYLQLKKYPKPINAYSLNEWLNSEREDPIIVDVREQSELEIACFQKDFLHLPLSKVSFDNVETEFAAFLDRKIVVMCHAGIRSYNFAQWSLDNNLVHEIWNLEEGIDGWSKYIDPTIPRY